MFLTINRLVSNYAAINQPVYLGKPCGRSSAQVEALNAKYKRPSYRWSYVAEQRQRNEDIAEFERLAVYIAKTVRVGGSFYRNLEFSQDLLVELRHHVELAKQAASVAFKRVAQEYAMSCVANGVEIEVDSVLSRKAYAIASSTERATFKSTLRELERSRLEAAGFEVYNSSIQTIQDGTSSRQAYAQGIKSNKQAIREASAKLDEANTKVYYTDPQLTQAGIDVKQQVAKTKAGAKRDRKAIYQAMAKRLKAARLNQVKQEVANDLIKERRQLNIAMLEAMAKHQGTKAEFKQMIEEFICQIQALKRKTNVKLGTSGLRKGSRSKKESGKGRKNNKK